MFLPPRDTVNLRNSAVKKILRTLSRYSHVAIFLSFVDSPHSHRQGNFHRVPDDGPSSWQWIRKLVFSLELYGRYYLPHNEQGN